jgi:transposase
VLARLRKQRFFSLAELNQAIRQLLEELNDRPMRRIGASRRELFDRVEKSALLPLPAQPYVHAKWKPCRAGIDYHVDINRHYYSVPSRLIRQPLEARITETTVEIFHRGERVAMHVRSYQRARATTVREHMPSAHRRYADWTPARLRGYAADVGISTAALVEVILTSKPHPEQGFRACVGILRLARHYGRERLERAATRALEIGARSYSSVASILKNGLDRQPASAAPAGSTIVHRNIRGPRYYQ